MQPGKLSPFCLANSTSARSGYKQADQKAIEHTEPMHACTNKCEANEIDRKRSGSAKFR